MCNSHFHDSFCRIFLFDTTKQKMAGVGVVAVGGDVLWRAALILPEYKEDKYGDKEQKKYGRPGRDSWAGT